MSLCGRVAGLNLLGPLFCTIKQNTPQLTLFNSVDALQASSQQNEVSGNSGANAEEALAVPGFVPLDEASIVDFVAGKPRLADRLGGAASKGKWTVGAPARLGSFTRPATLAPPCSRVLAMPLLNSELSLPRDDVCRLHRLLMAMSLQLLTSMMGLIDRCGRWVMATSTTSTLLRAPLARSA